MLKTRSRGDALGLILVILALVVFWQWLSQYYAPLVLPGPDPVCRALLGILSGPKVFQEIWTSVLRLAAGLAGAAVLGTFLGILMGMAPWGGRVLHPLIYLIQSVPPILFMTLAMIWFGLDGRATIFIVFIVCLPVMAVNLDQGFRRIDPDLIQMGKSFGFSRIKLVRTIIFPSLKTHFKSALILMTGLGWKLLIMGEVLSAGSGIGARITDARMNLETDRVFAWGLVVVALCLVSQNMTLGLARLTSIPGKKGHGDAGIPSSDLPQI